MTERPNWSATDRQRAYLLKLIEQRVVAEATAANVPVLCESDDFTKTDASELIDTLTKAPWKPKPTSAPVTVTESDGSTHVMTTLDDLKVSKFAIPVSEVSGDLRQLAGNSDLLFGEVRQWNGHKFINVLKGAPADWQRIRLARDKSTLRLEVVRILGMDQLKYVKLYGEHYACCGCCGAPLSDETSRRLQLGPDCRQRFGL